MKKIYEATGKDKRDIMELENEIEAFDKERFSGEQIGIKDIILIGRVTDISPDSKVNTKWSMNSLTKNLEGTDDIIILEPLIEQIFKTKIIKFSPIDTEFEKEIELSENAIILMSTDKYEQIEKDSTIKKYLDNVDLRLYEGEEDLAIKMMFYEMGYTYFELSEKGYAFDRNKHPDIIPYTEKFIEFQEKLSKELENGNIISSENINVKEKEDSSKPKESTYISDNCKKITGLTNEVEGDINIGNDLYATTNIGKMRKNQEDAVLLIKDKENPDFKMLVVADGMGGWSRGEIASDVVVNRLKNWFLNLSKEEKECYYKGISGLEDSLLTEIEINIQVEVQGKTWKTGGTTIVCSIVGKNDTLIANIGDSRAYISKDGKLIQISREDTVAQEKLEEGKTPSKEASRFDKDSNQLVQCIGMNRKDLIRPHTQIIKNSDYDMILLFSDGVTDCLSDEDIAVVCKNTDRKELTNKIVEKAIRHDSIRPEGLIDYIDLNHYIPGGKDNATAAVYAPNKNQENER